MKTSTTIQILRVVCAASFASLPAVAQQATEPLPITRVVLYKHGIGYFEREGRVDGRQNVALRFKQSEMSDVLKTLTVLDRSGGAIEAIAYDSQKPPEMLLAEFAFDLRTDNPQQELLKQLRGATVTADFAGRGVVTGSVLGIDSRVERIDGAEVRKARLSLLTDAGLVVSGEIADMRSLKFDDPKLASDIARFLEVLRTTHRRDQRSLDLVCDGDGARAIFAAYAVDQPVWKATYRLVIDGKEKPYLQGWAVVDNVSDEDWTNVRLSLVAGLPVSFRMDLYTPEFRARPILDVQEVAVARILQDRLDVDKAPAGRRLEEEARKGADELKQLGYTGGASVTKNKAFGEAFKDVESQSMTREIGDLLEYAIDHPVTIQRNRSALLPIVSGAVEGGKVALYNEEARGTNPFSAVRIRNTTGLSLEGGPLTVLEGETYAGEAMLSSLKPNETRYVPFAVDLGVKATTKLESKSERVFKVAFVNGMMIMSRYTTETKTYSFDNKNTEPRTVVVEHGKRPGLELRSPDKAQAIDSELDRYRFEVALAAQEKKSLAVVEAWPIVETFSIASVTPEQLTLFGEQRVLNDDAKRFLDEVVAARAEIARVDSDMTIRSTELDAIRSDENRLRKNREALGDSPEEKELVKLYVDQLKANEARVQALTKELTALRADRDGRQNALDQQVRAFALEYVLQK